MLKKRKANTKLGVAGVFLLCLMASAISILIFSLLTSLIANSLNDPTKYIGIFSLIAMLLSSAAAGITCSHIYKEGGMLIPSLTSLSMVLIMLLINVILSGGKVSAGAFMNYACYFGVQTAANKVVFLACKPCEPRCKGNV